MPRRDSANVAHTALTDHRILKRPDSGAPRHGRLPPGEFPLVPYPPGPHAPPATERERDRAIALANEFARSRPPGELGLATGMMLEDSLRRWPRDGAALLARSRAHASRGNAAGAVEDARAAVALEPDLEVALVQLAGAAVAADNYELAIQSADRLVTLSPSSVDHRITRAVAYFSLEEWAKAATDCRAALAIQPLHPNARFTLAVSLHKQGDAPGGRRELEAALRLTPKPQAREFLAESYRKLTR
jgi:tetratricopeptide (TPR) repeat protein